MFLLDLAQTATSLEPDFSLEVRLRLAAIAVLEKVRFAAEWFPGMEVETRFDRIAILRLFKLPSIDPEMAATVARALAAIARTLPR